MKRFTFLILIGMLLVSVSASAQQLIPVPMSPQQVETLLAQARASGSVRVMVAFAVPNMARAATPQQRSDAIKIARLGLLSNTRSGQARLVANSETWTIPYAALDVDAAALQALAATPGVLGIALDVPERRMVTTALPVIDIDDAHLRGTGSGYGGLTGEGWTVVVLDDGIQANHAFFGGRIVHEACFSTNGTHDNGVYTSMCPGEVNEAFGADSADTNSRCNNLCDHGTHVMGIAIGDDGAARKGAAPGANGIMINVFSFDDWAGTANDGPTTFVSDQVAGLEYVKNTLRYEYKIASINMSIGGGKFFDACDVDGDSTQQGRIDAIDELTAAGIAVVIASGNNGYKDAVSRPGCISSAITVSAIENNHDVASFSNVNEMVDFYAPGVSIDSSVPTVNGNYGLQSGTSMAAPFVTGAWAVIKQAAPNASVGEIASALAVTGIPIDDERVGGLFDDIPLIQVDAAIDLLRPAGNMVYNGDMETSGIAPAPDGWTVVGKAKQICNTPTKTITPFGNCALKVVAPVGTVSNAKHKVDLPRGIYDDQILFRAQLKAKNLVNGQLLLKIVYTNGDRIVKKIIINQPTATYDWMQQTASIELLNNTVQKIVVVAKVTPGGKYFLDNVEAILMPLAVDND